MMIVAFQRLLGTHWFRIALLAALSLLVLSTANPERMPASPEIGRRLIVADFVNDTADPALGNRLGRVLKLSLEQSRTLAMVADRDLQDSLRQVVLNPFAPLTADVARFICVSENIPGFLLPRVIRHSDAYIATTRLVSVKNGTMRESTVDAVWAQSEAKLVSAVEDMARRIRRYFGEDQDSIELTDRPLFSGGARIKPALQLFTEASALRMKGEFAGEISRLEAAASLEPGFALAHSRLANLYWGLALPVPALKHATAARALSSEIPPKERYGITGRHSLLLGDYRAAICHFEAAAALYPLAWDVHLALGDAALFLSDHSRAVDVISRALRLNPSEPGPYVSLCLAQLANGDEIPARETARQAIALFPDDAEVVAASGLLDLATSEVAGAIRVFRRMAAHTDAITRSRASFLLGQAEACGGRFRSALATLHSGIEEDRRRGYIFYEADKRIARAGIYLAMGDAESAAAECRMAPAIDGDSIRLASIGEVFARAGKLDDAGLILERLKPLPSSPLKQLHMEILGGEIALASGRRQEAVDAFRRALALRPGATARMPLARALALGGAWAEAETEYARISDRPAEVLFPPDRSWFAGAWAQVLYDHAASLAALGRNDEAKQQYRSYLWILDGADSDFPGLVAARAFLRKRTANPEGGRP